jgi:hypothetical protein
MNKSFPSLSAQPPLAVARDEGAHWSDAAVPATPAAPSAEAHPRRPRPMKRWLPTSRTLPAPATRASPAAALLHRRPSSKTSCRNRWAAAAAPPARGAWARRLRAAALRSLHAAPPVGTGRLCGSTVWVSTRSGCPPLHFHSMRLVQVPAHPPAASLQHLLALAALMSQTKGVSFPCHFRDFWPLKPALSCSLPPGRIRRLRRFPS